MQDLIAAFIRRGEWLSVQDFVGRFRGLTGSAKKTAVADAAGLTRKALRDLARGEDLDAGAVCTLLDVMRQEARPVQPKALGTLGKAHLETVLRRDHGVHGAVHYRLKQLVSRGIPYLIETAYGVKADCDAGATVVGAVNWSPALDPRIGCLRDALEEAHVEKYDAVAVVAHVVVAGKPEFRDQSKTSLHLPPEADALLGEALGRVLRQHRQEKRKRRRGEALSAHQYEQLRGKDKSPRSIRAACWEVMEQAYMLASDNNSLPARSRQVYYAARRLVLDRDLTGQRWYEGKQAQKSFTTVLLDFMAADAGLTRDWVVVFDDRGHFREPHTGKEIGVGTEAVREYIDSWADDFEEDPGRVEVAMRCPTAGPANRYGFVLFIEKEGFHAVLERARIQERYDIGLESTKGMSVTAARELAEEWADAGVTILVLHDFDKAGFSILHTLRDDTPRYQYRTKPRVIDLGLRLEDVRAWGLRGETVRYDSKKDPRKRLRECGATKDECDFLVQGRSGKGWQGKRAELNELTSPQFVQLLEQKFAEHGVAKVVPGKETLARAFRLACRKHRIQEAIDAATAAQDEGLPDVPGTLEELVRGRLKKDPALSWDQAVSEVARLALGDQPQAPGKAAEEAREGAGGGRQARGPFAGGERPGGPPGVTEGEA
jgi:hypothetical protein